MTELAELRIREETADDAEAVARVTELAFGRRDEARLVDVVRAAGAATLSLVATDRGEIIGHILFSPVTLDPPDRGWRGLGLAPMAVLPERQRQGIGGRLVREGLSRCRAAGWRVVVVLGHPGYYPRFGFVPASRFGLRSSYDPPDEAFMALELASGALCDLAGTVSYLPEFDEA